MMRLSRRATLLVAFSLLACATTASAECAWVLWTRHSSTFSREFFPDGIWFREAAYDTRTVCLDAGERQLGGPNFQVLKTETGWINNFVVPERGYFLRSEAQCWPDTIDPRGPKEK